jgi:hypothetical protein
MAQQSRSKGTRLLKQGMPDETLHQPPAAMAALGWIGVIAGVAANIWQMFTTISAIWQMFTGSTTPTPDFLNVTFDVCFLIAFSFQFALLYLVFRINSRWKKQQAGGSLGKKKKSAASGYASAAVEVVQQLGLFAIWVGLAFVIDTLGDFTFIGARTLNADASTSAFLVFLYAVALYALSTISFARAWEYLWAASAGKDDRERAHRSRYDGPRRDGAAQPKF